MTLSFARARHRVITGPVMVGTVCGLAWSASMRGWMAQIATASTVHWVGTFALVLLPGAVLGALLAWADQLRRSGLLTDRKRRWLVASPVVLAAALLDPAVFHALVTTGEGGGALAVVATGLSGGYALSHRGRRPATVAVGIVAVALALGSAAIAAQSAPLTTPRGALIAVQVVALLAVLSLACSIPHRTGPT